MMQEIEKIEESSAPVEEFEEDRPMTDHGLEVQLRKILRKYIKENTKLWKKLGRQTLFLENIRTGINGLITKYDSTIYPCECIDVLADVTDLIDKLEENEEQKSKESEE
jgi:hypothetical protein